MPQGGTATGRIAYSVVAFVLVLAWSGAALTGVMVTFAGIAHAADRVAVTDLRVERHPTQAGTYQVIMKIKNVGSTPWSNIPYRFADNGQPIVFQIEGRSTTMLTDFRTVAPGVEIAVSMSFPLSPGNHTISGVADPEGTLGERGVEFDNNIRLQTVVVPQVITGVVINVVEVESISFDPPQPVARQQGTVKMVIKNSSTGNLANVPWRMWAQQRVSWGGSPPPGVVLGSGQQYLHAGRGLTVSVPWAPWQTGTYDVVGEVDPENTLRETESARANNRKQLTVSVAAAARPSAGPPPSSPPPSSSPRECPMGGIFFACVIDADCSSGYFCCNGRCAWGQGK